MALEAYVPIVIFALIALMFPLGTFFATRLFRPDHPTPLKDLTYECGGPRRRGADPVPLPVLHVRSDFRRLRCRGGVPPPLGVRMGRAPELRVAGGQVLDLPLPRDHVRCHPIRAQAGGGHPDMSTVVRGAPVVVSGRPVPLTRKQVPGGLKASFGAKFL